MNKLDDMLKRIEARGGPTPLTEVERLHRIRIQILALCHKAVKIGAPFQQFTIERLLAEKIEHPESWAAVLSTILSFAEVSYPGIREQLERLIAEETALSEKVAEA